MKGNTFTAERQVLFDAITNISNIINKNIKTGCNVSKNPIEMIFLAEDKLEGWCSREKSMIIIDLITSDKPTVCIEIGVYGGRSLVPAAAALRHNGHGVIYGIETWSPAVAIEHKTNKINDEWWSKIDFHAIKKQFYHFIAENDLVSQIKLIEAPAANAAGLFEKIDYLHIDGAHSLYNATEDVILYAKKVKSGGVIIMDDVNWPTTIPAVTVLDSIGERIQSFTDDNGKETCIIFRKNS